MSSDDGLITGSARSVKEFNIYDGIDSCADLLEHFGGHKYAAGLTMKQENLEEFSQRFEEYVKENLDEKAYEPEITVDMMLNLSEITPQFLKNLKKFAPFGPGNMEPIFETDGVVDEGNARIVGDKHLKCRILSPYERGNSIDSIAFNQKALLPVVSDSKPFNVLYHVEENRWNNTVTTQLNIKDIEPADNSQRGRVADMQDDYAYRTSNDKKDSRLA
jgi:single-stranded-DNA-specific exonuclease